MIKSYCFPTSYLPAAAEHKSCVVSAAQNSGPHCQVPFEDRKTKAAPAPHLNEITLGGIKDVRSKAPLKEKSSIFPLTFLC